MIFNWFQRFIISIIFGYIVSQYGVKYINVTENTIFGVGMVICFGIGFIKEKWAKNFFFLLTLIAVLIPIGKIFRDGFNWTETKSYITAFAIFVPIMLIPTKWNRNVLNRVIISSGIAIEICIYFTKWVDYLPVEMFVAWMPTIYFLFHPHLLTFLFIFALNFLTGQWILDNLEIRWLIPATAGIVLAIASILSLVIKPKPPKRYNWSYSGGGSGVSSANDSTSEEFDQAEHNRHNLPRDYWNADSADRYEWDKGNLKSEDEFRNYVNDRRPNWEHLDD